MARTAIDDISTKTAYVFFGLVGSVFAFRGNNVDKENQARLFGARLLQSLSEAMRHFMLGLLSKDELKRLRILIAMAEKYEEQETPREQMIRDIAKEIRKRADSS